MSYKVAITDYGTPDLSIETEILASIGVTPQGAQCKTVEDVIAHTADADAVIVGFAPIKAEAIAAMKKAKVIVRYGIGYDNVDVAAAKAAKIPVCNVPDYCLDEVADTTLGFILGTTRQIVRNAEIIRQGLWKSAVTAAEFHCLRNMTIGLIGYGRIGRAVAKRLAAFGCTLVVYDPMLPPGSPAADGATVIGLDELLAKSDLVTLHCPSLPTTKGMINRANLAKMKRGAILINTSRGDLTITEDVVDALKSGQLSSIGFDVTNPEPLPADSPLRGFPQAVINAHLASVSPQAQRRLRSTAAELAIAAIQGKPLKNVVNGV